MIQFLLGVLSSIAAAALWYFSGEILGLVRGRCKVIIMLSIFDNDGKTDAGIAVNVSNSSAKDVHLQAIMLLAGGSKTTFLEKVKSLLNKHGWRLAAGGVYYSLDLLDIDDGCPRCIEPGQSHSVNVSADTLLKLRSASGTSRIMACAQDQLGSNQYSDPFDFWDIPLAKNLD